MSSCKSGTLTIPSEAHCTYCYAAELEAENARLKALATKNKVWLREYRKELTYAHKRLAKAPQIPVGHDR